MGGQIFGLLGLYLCKYFKIVFVDWFFLKYSILFDLVLFFNSI